MGKHRDTETINFISWLKNLGHNLGFFVEDEEHIGDGDYDLDLGFKITRDQHSIITFEVETSNTNTLYKNLSKLFASTSTKVKKPLYHFIIIYKSKLTEGQKDSVSYFLNFNNIFLFENVFNEKIVKKEIRDLLIEKAKELGVYKKYSYIKECEEMIKEFEINKNDIINTIEDYDNISLLDVSLLESQIYDGEIPFFNNHIGLYLKKYVDYYLLVCCIVEKDSKNIIFTYKLKKSIVHNVEIKSPLVVFQDFLEIFGCYMIVDGEQKKFVLNYRSEKKNGQPTMFKLVPLSKGYEIMGITYFVQISVSTPYTLNLFSHILNIVKYKEWLYTEKLISQIYSDFKDSYRDRFYKIR
ncbi:hypothetical protein KQH27_01075 [bacterium]|nr:hypothetical protein [bacterium]